MGVSGNVSVVQSRDGSQVTTELEGPECVTGPTSLLRAVSVSMDRMMLQPDGPSAVRSSVVTFGGFQTFGSDGNDSLSLSHE